MRGKVWLIGGVACLAAGCGGSSGMGGSGGIAGGAAGAAGQAGVAGAPAGAAGTGGLGGVTTGNQGGAGGTAGGEGGGAGVTTGGHAGSAGAGGANIQSGGQGGHGGQPAGVAGQGGVAGVPAGGQGGTIGGAGGQGGTAGQVAGRRLPWPCTAALPTGFCMQSDPGDFIGGGQSYAASGPGSVTQQDPSSVSISVVLSLPTPNSGPWDLGVTMPMGEVLTPGLYPVHSSQSDPTSAFLNVSGEGRDCGGSVSGQFSLEELTRWPGLGVTRFSLTFELHCGTATAALRGVVNYQATGTPDPTPVPDRVISLSGKVFRLAYDPTANVAYGLDATNTRIGKIDLTTGTTSYVSVTHVPNDGCVDSMRGRLFVANKASQTITEYATSDLSAVRDVPWPSMDRSPSQTQFHIYCTPDRLYAIDGASTPALFTVEMLDSATPVVTDRSAQLSAVNGLAMNAAGTDLYAWYQRYQTPTGVYVSRSRVPDLTQLDVSSMTVPNFGSAPADAPLLLDESRGYVFVKDKIFDASNLTNVIYTLPGDYSTLNGPQEVAYALDAAGGFLATKNFVYELTRFDPIAATIVPSPDQLFFDDAGMLWMLSTAQATLSAQLVHR